MRVFLIALLQVGRDGVVDEGLDASLLKVLLQAVAFFAKDGEEVICVVFGGYMAGKTYEWVVYTFIIEFGNCCSMVIVVIQVGEFDGEHGCLYLIDAAVVSAVSEYVFFFRAIVAQGAYYSSQFIVVGGDTASIAQCTKVLSWIEAVSGGMAERTGMLKLKIENFFFLRPANFV